MYTHLYMDREFHWRVIMVMALTITQCVSMTMTERTSSSTGTCGFIYSRLH